MVVDDNLVYDCELGRIDPEDPLGSLGITIHEYKDYIIYHIPQSGHSPPLDLHLPRDSDWAVLRCVIEDAEFRAKRRMIP